jgi:hypothetical protein
MNLKINRNTMPGMASLRVLVATVLAGIALALAVFGMIGQTGMTGHASLATSHFGGLSGSHMPGLVALGLSAASFVLSFGQKSYLVAGLLIAAGILYTIHLVPFMGDHGVVAFPGPVVGVLVGHVIFALGATTAIGSVRTRLVQRPNK